MAVMIREFWLENEIPLNCKVSPPVGTSVNRVLCCIDLTCTFGADGRIVLQRMTLARGMKKNKYNVKTDQAGLWLADQRCEMAVNQYLKGYGNHVLDSEPKLRKEIESRQKNLNLQEALDSLSKPQGKKKSAAFTIIGGVFKLFGLALKLVIMAVTMIARSFGKKE